MENPNFKTESVLDADVPVKERFMRRIKKYVTMTTLAISSFGVAEGFARDARAHDKEGEKSEAEYTQAIGAGEVMRYVFESENEVMFIKSSETGEYFQAGIGRKDNGFMTFEDMEKFHQARGSKFQVSHTHPIKALGMLGYGQEDVKNFIDGKMEPPIMPPSDLDLQGNLQTYEHFDDKGGFEGYEVVEPSGVWQIKAKDGNNLKDYSAVIKAMREIGVKAFDSLSPQDKELIKSRPELSEMHQNKVMTALASDPQTRHLAIKIADALEEEAERLERQYGDTLESLGKFSLLAEKIQSGVLEGIGDKEVNDLVGDYIKEGRDLGFEIKYNPNN